MTSYRSCAERDIRTHRDASSRTFREYEWLSRAYHQVLYCVSESIVSRAGEGDFEMEAGDRLDLDRPFRHGGTRRRTVHGGRALSAEGQHDS